MKRIRALIIALLAVALILAGCAGGGKSDTIKVGWLGALTGDQAVWGENELNTVKMLFEEYNNAGGIEVGGKKYKLEVIGYDNKGDAQEAVNVTKRLTGQDKVVAIIGPNSSGNAIPMAPILEKAKVPGIATVATNPKVTVQDVSASSIPTRAPSPRALPSTDSVPGRQPCCTMWAMTIPRVCANSSS